MIFRTLASVGFFVLCNSATLAQNAPPPAQQRPAGAPLQLNQTRPPAANAQSAIGRAAAPAAVPTISAAQAVQKANAWLNSVTTMVADFLQIGADGKRSEGKLYIQKPGRLRFEYAPPAVMEVIADGRSVAVRNRRLNTQDLAFIGQTPLKFLLKNPMDLSRDTKVLEVINSPNATSILIEDKATFGGTSRINLVFDPATFALKQWTIVDPQGFETIVSLFNIDLNERPNPGLFRINEERSRD
jgi:outer membrane lipoprotein-sorting protein